MKSTRTDTIDPIDLDSAVSLRVITSGMAIVGILAACLMAESPAALTLFGILGTAAGSYVSYRRRQANNFWIKWCIAAGILVVLGYFIEEILYRVQATIADARAPLTNMLVALQALHSFDLPRRRDLNVSALVGLTLMASAATLSRDLQYGIYLVTFLCFGTHMLYQDCISRTADSATQIYRGAAAGAGPAAGRWRVVGGLALAPVMAAVLFVIMPKMNIRLLSNVRVSVNLNLPFLSGSRVSNPLLSPARRGDGSLIVNPQAYFGFSEELDLNYRGKLSDQIVIKVGAPQGEFWRVMAFDTFDGHRWTMSNPHKTFDRLTAYGAAIPLSPVPSLVTPRRLPVEEVGQVFYLEQDQPNVIPAAAVPNLIYFPANKVQVDSYGSLRSPVLMEKDLVYTVFSLVPKYNLKTLQAQEPLPEWVAWRVRQRLANYLQLPDDLPPAVAALAEKAAGGSDNWFEKAERLSQFLQRGYVYNLEVPPTSGGKDAAADFLLNQKAGYCEHFATAFVIMCRTQGLPARLVTGFTPGQYNPFTGLWEVRMRDAHAWAEVFLPRWGWVPFDPTPDGAQPGLGGTKGRSFLEYLATLAGDLWKRIDDNPIVQHLSAAAAKYLAPAGTMVSNFFILLTVIWQPAAILMGILAAATVGVTLARLLVRVRRARPAPAATSRQRATQQFLTVCDLLQEMDVPRGPGDTADDLAARLKGKLAAEGRHERLSELVSTFMQRYSQARFGSDSPADDLEKLSSEIRNQANMVKVINNRPVQVHNGW